ncbi:CBO0543 family protein [Neobacillus drentensis]|uniref:CBO0543 family protein n=1 Tax=Neobacillus drentensis TaxID=220684 RepID=UPI002FFF2EA7
MDKFEYMWKIAELEEKVHRLDKEGWLQNEFLTWQWWVLGIFLIVPWLIWLRMVDKKRIIPILLFGMLFLIVTSLLDNIGLQFRFWKYPTQLMPVIPRALPFDCSMVPVAFMLVYQYFRSWKSYCFALVVVTVLFAFVGEPFSIWAELVVYIKWKYIYSFIYYIVLGVLIRFFIEKLIRCQAPHVDKS